MKPLLTADQAGELLGVPASWLLAQARRDAIPHRRLGKYVRFSEDDLEAWAQSRARGPRAANRVSAGEGPASGGGNR